MSYYKDDPIEFQLDTELDLTDATDLYIKYELHNGDTGYVTGVKDGDDDSVVVGNLPANISEIGILYYQPYISWDGGTSFYHGDKKYKEIEEPISVTIP